jgi:hypothetical protein
VIEENFMRSICKRILWLSIAICLNAFAEEVVVDSKNLHIPAGYDYNDRDITVFASGELPDTCYRRPEGRVKIDDAGRLRLEIVATRIRDPKLVCIMSTIPYLVPVSLGHLQLLEGTHSIVINADRIMEREFEIVVDKPSSTSVDNYSYANVTKVELIEDENGMKSIMIAGYHPTSCMSLTELRVLPNENRDTFSVLPIIEKISDECTRVIKPFSVFLPIPELGSQDVLVHVRKIDGHAINSFFPQE